MYFWIFRGGFGEASLSKASSKRKKNINQLSKNGEHYRLTFFTVYEILIYIINPPFDVDFMIFYLSLLYLYSFLCVAAVSYIQASLQLLIKNEQI